MCIWTHWCSCGWVVSHSGISLSHTLHCHKWALHTLPTRANLTHSQTWRDSQHYTHDMSHTHTHTLVSHTHTHTRNRWCCESLDVCECMKGLATSPLWVSHTHTQHHLLWVPSCVWVYEGTHNITHMKSVTHIKWVWGTHNITHMNDSHIWRTCHACISGAVSHITHDSHMRMTHTYECLLHRNDVCVSGGMHWCHTCEGPTHMDDSHTWMAHTYEWRVYIRWDVLMSHTWKTYMNTSNVWFTPVYKWDALMSHIWMTHTCEWHTHMWSACISGGMHWCRTFERLKHMNKPRVWMLPAYQWDASMSDIWMTHTYEWRTHNHGACISGGMYWCRTCESLKHMNHIWMTHTYGWHTHNHDACISGGVYWRHIDMT